MMCAYCAYADRKHSTDMHYVRYACTWSIFRQQSTLLTCIMQDMRVLGAYADRNQPPSMHLHRHAPVPAVLCAALPELCKICVYLVHMRTEITPLSSMHRHAPAPAVRCAALTSLCCAKTLLRSRCSMLYMCCCHSCGGCASVSMSLT